MKTTKPFSGILIIALALAGQVQAQSFLTNGLVAYYPFNGSAIDATGNGNNGQIIGNVVLATNRFGSPSNAYHFDGSFSVIEVTNTVFNVGQAGYTISGWFCSDDVTKSQQSIANTIPETGFGAEFNPTSAPGSVAEGIGPANAYWTFLTPGGFKSNYTSQTWYQYVFTKNGTSYASYVNGQVDSQETVPAASGYNDDVGFLFGSITPPGTDEVFEGRLDDFRIYNRALSSNEIQELYAYESEPPCTLPRSATATASVTNGFVIDAIVTAAGCGYTNAPVVSILGGGGVGATAMALVTNGLVVGIAITDAGSGYTSAPTIEIGSPGPCIPYSATATLMVTNGFVVGATVTDGGCGYTNTPLITILGGGGSGATATALVTNGVVVGIMITDAGGGYTSAPNIYINSPVGFQIGLLQAVVPAFSGLSVGSHYQLQTSSDLATWSNQYSAFMATNPSMIFPQYFLVSNGNQLFLRLQGAP